jgi:hypothetical protein
LASKFVDIGIKTLGGGVNVLAFEVASKDARFLGNPDTHSRINEKIWTTRR